jgi:hypothetical protein
MNCRRTNRITKLHTQPTQEMLAELATACRNGVLLLLFFGLFGHNMYRFNWLWLAAIALLCAEFSNSARAGGKEQETTP